MKFTEIKKEKNKKIIAFILTAVIAILTVATAAGYNFGYNLYIDEEYVGSFASAKEASDIIEIIKAEDGIDFSDKSEIVFGLMTRADFTEEEEACFNVKAADSRYCEGYVLFIDGEKVFAVETLEEAEEIKNEVLSYYSEEDAVRVEFTRKSRIKKDYVLKGSFSEKAEALELLSGIADVETVIITKENEVIPCETREIATDELYEGCSRVIEEGSDGEAYIEHTTLKINGETISEYDSKKYTVKEMKNRVIEKGTKKAPEGITKGFFINPSEGVLTSPFGPRWGRMHKGIDISDAEGTPIYASDGGKVTYSGWMDGYGYLIVIDHGNRYKTYYAHCSALHAEEGEYVTQGQHIADMGSTGRSTGTHLHFEVRYDDVPEDPEKYVNY